MIIKILNLDKKCIGFAKDYKNVKIESVLKMGQKKLYFTCRTSAIQEIKNEYYLEVNGEQYIVKENSNAGAGFRNIVAELNLEDIKGKPHMTFSVEDGGVTAKECADAALTGTGWVSKSEIDGRKRWLSMLNTNSYAVFEKICDLYACELQWDTANKTVYLKEKVGEERKCYFAKGLNLVELSDNSESYDFYTRIVPIGKDGLTISEVNGNIPYIDNFQYSSRIKTLIWEDTNYKDAEALKADAEYKLNELSKPKKTFSAKTIDLAKFSQDYSHLKYGVGDTILLVDSETGTCDKQRVVKTIEYPENPIKNSCELSNTTLSFEEMQKKLFAAANSVDNVTNGNIVIGGKVQGLKANQVEGLEIYYTEALSNTKIEDICK